MNKLLVTLLLLLTVRLAYAQKIVNNYDEANVGTFALPDPLALPGGGRITTAKQWEMQRASWLRTFQETMYGYTPDKKLTLRFQVVETKHDALNGQAIRKRINIYVTEYPTLLPIELVLYVPKAAKKPVPVFVSLNFVGNHGITAEKDIPLSERWMRNSPDTMSTPAVVKNKANEWARGVQTRRWPLEAILERGYAVATAYYGDIEPDHRDGWKIGIRSMLGDTAKANNWGAIGAWAWGLSRMLDYLETDKLVDAKKAISLGHSRLGKAALWAGVQDTRFAMTISNDSGEGGATLTRRNFGENVFDIHKNNSFWYCKNYFTYLGHPNDLPMDQHILLALVAPRPLYIASASQDLFADPKGEFLSALNAEPVYKLYGKAGLGTTVWPRPGMAIGNTIGYHLRDGIHDILLYDWERFMNFADKNL
ncbi:putative acetyl xylan esterase [Fibrisoma limi BUZ 3]|uniref:Putative acetyl xylan esterase n=1 Tax=Fibrisoma limi BUZ 3 TaxID=1185876 RepID=I2GE77_9BACT|nr:hypothetical protein [Fibrisoma limi]CCH52202.1 putative acetyl xylan esterase [Fibrisoma limi BUZ 3]